MGLRWTKFSGQKAVGSRQRETVAFVMEEVGDMAAKNYRDLIVWQKAMDLTEEVYRLSKFLPKEELYSLTDQMRRAAVSISSNIAEGQGRGSIKSFIHFLSIARGSKAELETQLLLCVRLGYLKSEQVEPALGLCDEIGRMIFVLTGNLEKKLTSAN